MFFGIENKQLILQLFFKTTMNPQVLICYSNPSGTTSLRLDKEHSSIENALKLASIDPCVVKRLITFDVFINEVANGKYSVIQFSGHGSCDGVYFENKIGSASEIISADSLANALSLSQIPIMALILTCCYSEDHISELSKYAHYLITVDARHQMSLRLNSRKHSFLNTLLTIRWSVRFKWR